MIGEFHDGFAIGGAYGRRFNDAIRGELEFSFRNFDADDWNAGGVIQNWDGDLNAYLLMANLYRDCLNCQIRGITPYVGGGLGLAIIDGDFNTVANNFEIEDEAFAYQGMAGLTKRISQRADGFVEYRYVGTTDVTLNRTTAPPNLEFGQFDGSIHNVLFGIRIWR